MATAKLARSERSGVRQPAAAAGVRVLVVDDDQSMREYICEALAECGFEAIGASNGEEAVSLFRRERITVVLLDIFMAGKDGFETLTDLRRSVPDVKVIAMSGYGEYRGLNPLEWAKKLGARGLLPKPFTPDELVNSMNAAVRS